MKKHALMPLVFYLISTAIYYVYTFIKIGDKVPSTYIILGYALIAIPLFSISYGYIAGKANKNSIGPTLTNSIIAGIFSLAPYIISIINKEENKLLLATSIAVVIIVGLITYFPAALGTKRGKEKAEKQAQKELQKQEKLKQEEEKQNEEQRKLLEIEIKEKISKEKEEEFAKQMENKTQKQIDQEIENIAKKP